MARACVAVLAAGALFAGAAATEAVAQPTRTGVVTAEQAFRWDGAVASGANTDYSPQAGGPCGRTPPDQCDITLLRVNVDARFWERLGGGVEVTLTNFRPNPASDFDLYVYESDASGSLGKLVSSSGHFAGEDEAAVVPRASGWYRVHVVYSAVTASRYTGTASLFTRSKHPPDIDAPPGLQEQLVSDPSLGFRSRSEPHLAQSPLDPNLLVGGSKLYNRDPDSLAEYEFKIGTYVSFDGGARWADLGQLGVCSPNEAPPASWPANRCYPDENPALGGTGPEDVDDPADRGDRADPRGSGDVGEEYLTSDPWLQFDDEGNAYAMVLDAPPFQPDNLSGVGMTLHRWESVSPEDIIAGRTWSDRIVIDSHPSEVEQRLFFDDKNTFAVNNAGDDRDGKTGPMVACWGQLVRAAIRVQIVCERATDGGRSWPGRPLLVSPPDQQLAFGPHVVADPRDENTFYVAWLNVTPRLLPGDRAQLWVAKSVDGGITWPQLTQVTQLTPLPLRFPRESFRNTSLPILAVGPQDDLSVVYAEYLPAPQPATDLDGMQADIRLVRSPDGGLTWSEPSTVNQDRSNADQFQPYIAARPDGALEVAFFDRRHDPENFFIDQYLARSSDGGLSWTEIRVSHDAWDPSLNPPISPSGDFIGDYQALVADRCATTLFFNDTHLANDPRRDPGHDPGLPRSVFQEVFAWRVATGACGQHPPLG